MNVAAIEPNAAAFIEAVSLAATLYTDVELAFWLTAPQPLIGMWTPVQLLARGEAGLLLGRLQAMADGVYI